MSRQKRKTDEAKEEKEENKHKESDGDINKDKQTTASVSRVTSCVVFCTKEFFRQCYIDSYTDIHVHQYRL